MSLIKILPDNISNKIAAGEVIERPASVVKELVENSVDAGADKIDIYIEKAGKKLITVLDNGSGMDPDDALLCIEPHATSKINTEHDITNITTMGFRGEAIPSIASVSRLRLRTRQEKFTEGREVIVNGGKLLKEIPSGCAPGTEVNVSDLFFNIPARRKFLKSDSTEEKHINDTICMLALANYHISFSLYFDGRRIISSPGSKELLSRICDFFGKNISKNLIRIDNKVGDINIFGYISSPGYVRSSRREQRIFVNRRPIKNNIVYYGIRDAYDTMIMKDTYPIVFLFIDLPADKVDINVHPAKHEARFRNGNIIRKAVSDSLRNALRNNFRPSEAVKQNRIPFTTIFRNAEIDYVSKTDEKEDSLFDVNIQSEEVDSRIEEQNHTIITDKKFDKDDLQIDDVESVDTVENLSTINKNLGNFPNILNLPGCSNVKFIGVVKNTYILCSSDDTGLIIIDQHAAHERVLFEKLLYSGDSEVLSQKILFPINIDLSVLEYNFLIKNYRVFNKIGFEIQDFGNNTILVTAIPTIYKMDNIEGIISDLIEELLNENNPKKTVNEESLAMAACKMAVKANDIIQKIEAEALVKSLANCKLPFSCPHGRPTVINISEKELEKRFGRRP